MRSRRVTRPRVKAVPYFSACARIRPSSSSPDIRPGSPARCASRGSSLPGCGPRRRRAARVEARQIDGRGQPGRAGADDQAIEYFVSHRRSSAARERWFRVARPRSSRYPCPVDLEEYVCVGSRFCCAFLAGPPRAGPGGAGGGTGGRHGRAARSPDRRAFLRFQQEAHVPGLVWGIVQDGRLVHVGGAGVQELESRRPVNAETLFRIASMSKAFTALAILKLRDEGRLSLEAPAETYVPELRGWRYPPAICALGSATCSTISAASSPTIPGATARPLPEARVQRPAARRCAVHPAAADGVRIFELRLCRARPDRHQRLRPAVRTISWPRSWARSAWPRPATTSPVPPPRAARSAIAGRMRPGRASPTWPAAPSARWAASRPARTIVRAGSPSCSPPGRLATAPSRGRRGARCASWPRAPTSCAGPPRPGGSRDACPGRRTAWGCGSRSVAMPA